MRNTHFAAYLFLILLFGCSSDSEEFNENQTPEKYIKSFVNNDAYYSFYNQYFEYENGILSRVNRQDDYNNRTFYYDDSGKLKSAISDLGYSYQYFYDESNRLILETASDVTGVFLETSLNYNENQVTISRINFSFIPNISHTVIHYLDSKGRIIKIVKENESESFFKTVEYFYDEKGNIYKESYKDSAQYDDYNLSYSYLDIINPFYIAHEKLLKSYYHIYYFYQISNYNFYGVSPFLIKGDNYVYSKDKFNYPTSVVVKNVNAEVKWFFEYY